MLRYVGKLVASLAAMGALAYSGIKSQAAVQNNVPSGIRIANKKIPPVLMYHEIRNLVLEARRGQTRPLESSDVTTEAFFDQMSYLSQYFTSISTQDLYDYLTIDKPLPPRPVLITLDDGYLGNYDSGLNILDIFNLKATMFVHTTYVGTMAGNTTTPTSYDHMGWDHLRWAISNPRYEVFSHTMTHPRLTDLSDAALDQELRVSKEELEKNLVRPSPFLAYPFGAHDRRVIEAAKKYYQMAFIVSRPIQNIDAIYQIPRLIVGKESLNVAVFRCRVNQWELGLNPNICK